MKTLIILAAVALALCGCTITRLPDGSIDGAVDPAAIPAILELLADK